jgi:phage tail-like protein
MSARSCLFASFFAATAILASPVRAQSGPVTIKVEIDGVTQGLFDVVEGLGSVGDPKCLDQKSAEAKSDRIVLRRGYDPALNGLWNWRRSVVEGNPQKRDGRILLFGADGNLTACWTFHRGWPARWEVPRLQANAQDPGEEIVEIVHEGLTLDM